ncbi:MAG TPA: hypothetical protein VJ085_02100 [Candidatus Acidoferrales bacterium]|nr:hypothetical protein [Candidatus Acidoferrales bacterium]
MTSEFREVIQQLQSQKRQLMETRSHVLNFESEGPTKTRKLAQIEGELAGIEAAIRIVEKVSTSV